ncbi:MAG: polyphenol oxidase family protein [Candidatus Neomarinimicrobiota bacterium]
MLDFSRYFNIPGLIAGFSDQVVPVPDPDGRAQLASALALNPRQLCIPVQIHSSAVLAVTSPGIYEDVDGLVTRRPDLVLSLQVADCIPLYLADPHSRTIGLVHIGWRGAAAGIVERAIDALHQSGSAVENLVALTGPCIRQKNFEVGPEVAENFHPDLLKPGVGDRFWLDLPGAIKMQLAAGGLNSAKILDTGLDTYQYPEQFHSYRRDGTQAGRNFACFGWSSKVTSGAVSGESVPK